MTDIIHLQNQKLSTYKGNYDIFERTREEQVKNQTKAFESSERSRSHMQVSFPFLQNDLMNSIFFFQPVYGLFSRIPTWGFQFNNILFSAAGVH